MSGWREVLHDAFPTVTELTQLTEPPPIPGCVSSVGSVNGVRTQRTGAAAVPDGAVPPGETRAADLARRYAEALARAGYTWHPRRGPARLVCELARALGHPSWRAARRTLGEAAAHDRAAGVLEGWLGELKGEPGRAR